MNERREMYESYWAFEARDTYSVISLWQRTERSFSCVSSVGRYDATVSLRSVSISRD